MYLEFDQKESSRYVCLSETYCMCRVRAAAGVLVDPLQPMLSTMASLQVLQVVRDGYVLGLDCAKEVLHDWVCIVAKADFDRSLETVEITVLTSPLIGLMLLHQRNQLLGGPTLHLEVVIVRSGRTSVHLESVNGWNAHKSYPRLTMKLILDPPPKIWAHGTIARRPASHSEGRE